MNSNLTKIAKYIKHKYPNSCLSSNYTEQMIDEMDTEYLVEQCIEFFCHEKIKLCGCGVPENTYEMLRLILNVVKEHKKSDYSTVVKSYEETFKIDMDNDLHYAMWHFILSILDECEIVQHGSSLNGAWLTEEGNMLLEVLNKWKELEELGY